MDELCAKSCCLSPKGIPLKPLWSVLITVASFSIFGSQAQAGCDMTPTSPLEIRRALMNQSVEKLPSTICLPKWPQKINDMLSISRDKARFTDDPKLQAKMRKSDRNGEMGGWIEFPYGTMFEAMLGAIEAAGSPTLRSKAASALAHMNERAERHEQLDSKPNKTESDKAELEKLEQEYKAGQDFLFDAIASLEPGERSALLAAVPAGQLNLQTSVFPRGAWQPGTAHTGTAETIPIKHPLTILGHFHTHPPGTSHFHSHGDVSNDQASRYSRLPLFLGSFVLLEGTRKMTWQAPSAPFAAAKKARGEDWDFSSGHLALCSSLRWAELHDWKSRPSDRVFSEARADCIVWASEMQGSALYEANNDAGEFRRRPLLTSSPAIALLADNLPDAPRAAPTYPEVVLKSLLKFIAQNEGLFESGETPLNISESRIQAVLGALRETYIGKSIESTTFRPAEMQRLLLAIAHVQRHSWNFPELVICRGGTRWIRSSTAQPSVRPCVHLGVSKWESLPWSGEGTLTARFGDFSLTYQVETDHAYPRLERNDVAFALSLKDGQMSESTHGERLATEHFASENEDWGVAPTTHLKGSGTHNSPTPKAIPGGRVVRTLELKSMLEARNDIVIIDTTDPAFSRPTNFRSVPGAYYVPFSGIYSPTLPDLNRDAEAKLSRTLQKITEKNKKRPLIFLASSVEDWDSYNASRRAISEGYRNVYWYRGGLAAWRSAGIKWEPSKGDYRE